MFHTWREVLLWRSWNTWIIARMNIEECIKRFLCEAESERREHIFSYDTLSEVSMLYIGRISWGAKEEKSTQSLVNDLLSARAFFDMPRTLFSFLTLLVLSKLSISVEILFLLFAAHNRHSQNYVCAFFRKGGKGGVFPSIPFRLDYNIILLLCWSFPFKKIYSLVLSNWGREISTF